MPTNRMLTDAELRRFRIEHAADLASMKKNGTLFGATDEIADDVRKRLANAQSRKQVIAMLRNGHTASELRRFVLCLCLAGSHRRRAVRRLPGGVSLRPDWL